MTVITKPQARLKRRHRVRAKVAGTAERPRIAVFRSNRGIHAQLIDDVAGHTLAAVSPTSCLSMPLTTTSVGWGTSKSIPSGASSWIGCE
jgi:ribosomal protein L18